MRSSPPTSVRGRVRGPRLHALFVVATGPAEVQAWLRERHPELRVMSVGERIEIYKEAVDPREFVARFGLADLSGTLRSGIRGWRPRAG